MRYNQTVILKNKKQCLLRHAEAADAEAVLDNFNLTHGQTDFLLSYPEENGYTIEQERQFLIAKENNVREIEICAFIDGKLVGTAGIEAVGQKYKVQHRTELGISIEKDYWGLGIGSALLKACIECAKKTGYIQMELDVVADNLSAISLYKKFGFVEYGRNPKGFRSHTLGWQEIILMHLTLD